MTCTRRRRVRSYSASVYPTSFVALALIWSLASSPVVHAASVPPGFAQSQVVSGLTETIAMAFAPDGRLFVCEKAGRVRVIDGGVLQAKPFLALKNVETAGSNGSNGLLGIAFDPQFLTNRFFYVHYTVRATRRVPAHNRISRFTANGSTASSRSERVLLELPAVSTTGHYGGDMRFGPDGKLYIAIGMYDSPASAQALTDLKGKILRIATAGGSVIPADNPFVGQATGVNAAIWALGLRNPFTFAFDPLTGRMFINDVGEVSYEEINEGAAGANYGWPLSEGPSSDPSHVSPVYYYGRADGCALTAGTFYSPQLAQFPASYIGQYFFADWCDGWIRTLDPSAPSTATTFATGTAFPMDLEVGPDGALYYIQWHDGAVYKIEYGVGSSAAE